MAGVFQQKQESLLKRDVPNHSDYDVFLSPLSDFKKAMEEAGLGDKVVYLDRKDAYAFKVNEE